MESLVEDGDSVSEDAYCSSTDNKESSASTQKQPPIYVKNCSALNLIKLYKDNKLEINFKIKNTAKNSCKLTTAKIEIYQRTINTLKRLNVEFITFTHKSQKPKSILLKGPHEETTCDQVHSELTKQLSAEVKINKISLFSGKPNSGITFLVQTTSDSDSKPLTNIKSLNYQIIKWERLRKKELLQCRRCQTPGHVAINCNMAYRCVKCTNIHEPGQCTVNKENNDTVSCVLCGKTGHPASYRGCEVRTREMKKIMNRNKTRTNPLVKKTSKQTYAEALTERPSQDHMQQQHFRAATRQQSNTTDEYKQSATSFIHGNAVHHTNNPYGNIHNNYELSNSVIDTLSNNNDVVVI
ncbi:hypothetical protein TKK_0017002 [Trichogramma kaykai]|uniref:Gag-like protein n=1 Tax=Trichogramma kaykai TaxID=54128 RepID=A0ABD2W4U8_9HYME